MLSIQIEENLKMELLIGKDSDELFKLIEKNRSYLGAWLPWVETTISVRDVKLFIKSALIDFSDNNNIHYKIVQNGNIIGIIGAFLTYSNTGTYEIAYWIDKDFSNRGIVTKCTEEIIAVCYEYFPVRKIEIKCAVENLSSNAIPRKLGFLLEGTIRNSLKIGNNYFSYNIYGLMK